MSTNKKLSLALAIALSSTFAAGALGQGNGRGRGGGGGDKIAPAAITDLGVVGVTHNTVSFTWTATGDDGNQGTASRYDLRYAAAPINGENWSSALQADGEPTPQVAGTLEQFTLSELPAATAFYFAIRVSDERDNVSGLSNIVEGSTAALPFTPWSTSLVDAQDDPGKWSSVAFNPITGLPAVAYHVTNEDRPRRRLNVMKYAAWNGSSWDVETIATQVGPLELEFDPNTGLPFIAFKCGAEVHVAWHDGNGWQTELVDMSFETSSQVSVEFNPTGQPTLAYAAPTPTGGTIRFATLIGGNWVSEDVGTIGAYDLEHRFDPATGYPAIAFRWPVKTAVYTFFDGSQWITEIIPTGDVLTVTEIHLEFNPISGNAMVAYQDFPSIDPLILTRVRLVERTGAGLWSAHNVFNDPENFDTLYDFAVDAAGTPLFLHGVSGELFFSWWNGTEWVNELVFPGEAHEGWQLSLDVGPNGEVAAAFQRDAEGNNPNVENKLMIGIR